MAVQAALLVLVLAVGVGAFWGLLALRKPPPMIETPEAKLRVQVRSMQPEEVPVMVSGFGMVRSLDTVVVMPQVAGMVVEVHPNLDQGAVIHKDETLFRIDARDYEIAKEQAETKAAQMRVAIALLKKQYENDQSRIDTLKRTRDLAEIEFQRDKELFEKHKVGTESMLHMSEVNANQADDAFDMVANAIGLYPLRIQEAETGLKAATTALEQATLALERTNVRAPFTGRVRSAQVEVGQVVAPGSPAVTLANDAALEISVPLDSRDAGTWLEFGEAQSTDDEAWFSAVAPVRCQIRWTEAPEKNQWTGTLARVERFDPMTRTVTVAVRVTGEEAMSSSGGLPLVDGMFCTVEIPGKTMRQVFRLPRWAVTFDSEVYIANAESRLERRVVEVLRSEEDEVYISSGLEAGELAIVTRLVSPLPNSLLEYTMEEGPEATL